VLVLFTGALACALPGTTATAYAQTAKAPAKKTQSQREAEQARARAAARQRAAAQQRALQEAAEPRYKLDESGALVPDIRAEAAIIYNPETGEVLWETNSRHQRSIASITKVMTAVVLLEDTSDLSQPVTVSANDVSRASVTYLRQGDVITREDLLHLLLIASDNAAARTIARTSPGGTQAFVARMNARAEELGLTSTRYAEPSGLLAANVSSAYDIARLIAYVSDDERIAGIMRKQNYTARAGRRQISIHSTNQLVRQGDVDVQAGKTGFIRMAGYCLATLLRLPEGGPQVAVVVLGAPSSANRFWETRHLFRWLSAKAEDLLGTTSPLEAAGFALP
jgi:serine-type D-Ala-D-Ala endopeptidase (penicillin-binding protein 7)